MNYIKDFYHNQDKVVFWSTTFVAFMILLQIIPFFIFSVRLPEQLPIFYSLPWGEQQLANKQLFLVLPLLCASTVCINLFIAWHLHPSQLPIKRVLATSAAIISIIFLIAGVRIISLFI